MPKGEAAAAPSTTLRVVPLPRLAGEDARGQVRARRDTLYSPASLAGRGPPVAQSTSSTVWTTGTAIAPAICTMQPMLPAATTSGRVVSMFAALRRFSWSAISGCSRL